MKRNIIIISIFLIIGLLFSFVFMNCDFLFGKSCPENDPNSKHYFWTINLGQGMFDFDTSDMYCEIGTEDPVYNPGGKSYVYMQYTKYDQTVAQKVADEFDKMYDTIINNFGDATLTENNEYNNNNDRRVNILLLDIPDNFDPIFNPAYVGGYFYSVDYITEQSLQQSYPNDHSNEQAILYIDIDPQDATTPSVVSTVAHEFQHMINFSENVLAGGVTIDDILEGKGSPTWINEGFSMGAEQIWAKNVPGNSYTEDDLYEWGVYRRISYFNDSSQYTEGNPLIKWISNESEYDVLSNYSNSYLFFQYLRTHSSLGNNIFKTMTDNTDNSIQQVNDVLGTVSTASSFDELLQNWLIANRINDTSGEYGYNNEEGLRDVQAFISAEEKEWGFYPGSFMYRTNITVPSLSGAMKAVKFDNSGYVADVSGGDVISSSEYVVLYNSDVDPNGSAITVTVPAGSSAKGGIIKTVFDPNEPSKIDWLFTKPLSKFGAEEYTPLPKRK